MSAPPGRSAPGLRRVLGIVAVNLVVLAAGLLVAELIFGGWLRSNSMNRLNLVRDRVYHFSTRHLYPSETGTAVYTRDTNALRGSFGDPARITLLTVGGSTTDQRYISDDATWQAVLEESLRARGREVVVGNAGVDGQSTFGHLKNLEWWFPHVPGLHPKQMLYFVGVNDFYKEEGYRFDDLVTPDTKRGWKQVLREKSALYGLLYTFWGMYQAQVRHRAGHMRIEFERLEWTAAPLLDDHETRMRRHLDGYDARLRELVRRTRAFGSEPILVTQPTRWYRVEGDSVSGVAEGAAYGGATVNGVDLHRMMRLLDRTLLAVAADSGVAAIDLGGATGWADEDFYDYAHMTPAGARKLGGRMAAALDTLLGAAPSER